MMMAFSSALAAAPEPGDVLHDLLKRLDHTASLYAEAAMGFSCTETIRWEGRDAAGRRKFGYVVTIDGDGNFEDYRTLVRKHRKETVPKRVEPTDYGVPVYLRSAYLWVFVFKRDRWSHHRYELTGEEEVFGRTATLLKFEPIAPYKAGINEWFGTAWVDNETAQLLKVVSHSPEDEKQFARIKKHAAGEAASSWVYVVEQMTTEFTIVKRGLRLPGRVTLHDDSYDFMRGLSSFKTGARTILRVNQDYTNYQFFDVEINSKVTDKE